MIWIYCSKISSIVFTRWIFTVWKLSYLMKWGIQRCIYWLDVKKQEKYDQFLNVKLPVFLPPWEFCFYSFFIFNVDLFFQPPWRPGWLYSLQYEYACYIPFWSSSLDVSVSLWLAYLSNHFYSSKLCMNF